MSYQLRPQIAFIQCCFNFDAGTVLQGSRKRLEKYNTNASITIVPTADDDGVLYACEASHPAIPAARPMRATVKLSVLCK